MEKMLAALTALQSSLENLPPLELEALDPARTLIFTVDMNVGFARKGALASPRTAGKVPAAAAFLAHCREKNLPVYGITDTHPADCREFDAYPPHCIEGTEECAILPELAPYILKTFPKNSTNAVFAPEILGLCGTADTVVITGCCTDICIYQFAVGLKTWANQQGRRLEVTVPVSLCDTYDAPGHDAGLMNLVFFSSMAANGVKLVQ